MSAPKRLFLIDGMALIYRSHFALIKNPLMTSDGRYTSAIFGFMNSLFKLLKDEDPDYIAIVLDSKEPTFRHELFPEYKANRESTPEDLIVQIEPLLLAIENLESNLQPDEATLKLLRRDPVETRFLELVSQPETGKHYESVNEKKIETYEHGKISRIDADYLANHEYFQR